VDRVTGKQGPMADDSLTRMTIIGTGWMMGWRMLTRVLGLASTLILARLLMPADFGIVAMAAIFSSIVGAFSELGIGAALVRHPRRDRSLFDTAWTLQVIRALLIGGLLVASAPVAVWWFAEPRLFVLMLILAGCTLLNGLGNIGIVEFQRDMRFDRSFRVQAVPRLLQVVATICCALLLRNYWALIIGVVTGSVARLAVSYLFHSYRPRLRLAEWREFVHFSLWTWASSLAGLVWSRCDWFLLGPVIGPAGLGLYMLALETAVLPVSELIAPAGDVLFAGFAEAQRRGNTAHLATRVATTLLLFSAPVTIAISASASHVVAALLGAQWAAAQPLIAILAWQCLFSPFSYVCSQFLVAKGLVRMNFFGTLLAAAIKLAATLAVIALTHDLSVISLIVTLVVAAEATIFLVMLRLAGETGFRANLGGLLRILIAGAVTVGVLLVTGLGWQGGLHPPVTALLLAAAIGGVSVAGFALANLGLWQLVGRPDGPERQLLDVLGRFIRLRRPRVQQSAP
jgi:O-antigen/teichoic acid export membrane protein